MIIKYIKNMLKVLCWPTIFIVGQFLIQACFCFIFNIKTNFELINTDSYTSLLQNYLNDNLILIALISFSIFFYIFSHKYKIEGKWNFKNSSTLYLLIMGSSISLIYNILIYYLNTYYNFTNAYKLSDISIFVQILTSGILGPILEEYVFRGIVYNKLKMFNSKKTSMLLTTILFAIIHTNFINMIFAFFIGFVFVKAYDKYNNLFAPILVHMAANTTIILFLPLLIKNIIAVNVAVVVTAILLLISSFKKMFSNKEQCEIYVN